MSIVKSAQLNRDHLRLTSDASRHYSLRNDFTGFAIAALIAWTLTVSIAMNNATVPATAKTHQRILVRYAKSCSHRFITNHAIGDATRTANIINFKKSFDSIDVIFNTDAPNTFRIPISLVRISVVLVV